MRARLSLQQITLATACVGLLLTASLGACSSRPEDYLLATGEFVWEDGTPLTGVTGLVRFSPSEERHTRASSTGELRADGTFEVSTYETQHGQPYKGLLAGDYNVVLLEYDRENKERVVPEKYRHFEESPWRATVAADRENHFKLVVAPIEQQDSQ